MAAKNKKSKGKRKTPKTSLTKLSNKHLNKLAKQGKLKKRGDKKKLLRLIEERTKPEDQKHHQGEGHHNNEKEEKDIPLEEADYEYFAKPGREYSFLSDVSDSPDKKRRKRKKTEDQEEDESHYEKQPRKTLGGDKAGVKALLPIKSREHGVVPQTTVEESDPEETLGSDNEVDPAQVASPAKPEKPLPALTTAQLYALRQDKLAQCKQRIALLASTVMEEPEENMRKLKELRLMLEEEDPVLAVTVRKLVSISLLEVFKDMLPEYRIRVASDKEKEQTAKKETKKLRDFEEALLSNYRLYLEFLEGVVKGKPQKTKDKEKKKTNKYLNGSELPKEANQQLKEVALKCLCELLISHPHFNFRTNIISLAIPFANDKKERISDLVCDYIKRIFRADKGGEVTLEITRLIGRIIKAAHFNVQPKVLRTFLALKIKEIDKGGNKKAEDKAARREKFRKLSRRDRKRKKQMMHLEKELENAAVEKNESQRLKLHTEIISIVFLTYFRILKNARRSVLLTTVLEGLARFAHLINLEFFDDLFAVLSELVTSEELGYTESLHCVQTAFTILSGQGAALNIDPLLFYTHLYRTLFQLHAGVSSQEVSTALECLDIMISKRRKQVSLQRTMAFMKRLATLTLQMQSHGALGLMATLRNFLQSCPKSEVLLDTSCEGSGVFLPELEEPEHCNAHNTALYELYMLTRHYHPTVRRYGQHLLAGAPSHGHHQLSADMARRSPMDLFKDYDPSDMTFTPAIDAKPRSAKKKATHPLSTSPFQARLQEALDTNTPESLHLVIEDLATHGFRDRQSSGRS